MKFTEIVKREEEVLYDMYGTSDTIKNRYDYLLKICETIDDMQLDKEELDTLLKDINSINTKNIICPLKLTDDEFTKEGMNKRCPYFFKTSEGIINIDAYNLVIKKSYNHVTKEETKKFINDVHTNPNHVYLTAGGVLTGKYFNYAYIRPSVVLKHKFNVQNAINIPVSLIYGETDKHYTEPFIYTMDKREPKFTALKQFYDIPIETDENIEKIDIRKFKKLTDNGI